jgi:DNA polymerase-3 subunit beta
MQFSISRDSLLRPLQLVSGSIGGRPTLPILSNVLLNVTEQRLSLTGTDLEVEMVGLVPLNGAVVAGNITRENIFFKFFPFEF